MPDLLIDESKQDGTKPTTRRPPTFLPEPEARRIWCPLISVDDHVLEPPDTFTARVPASARDRMPHVEYVDHDGEEVPVWVFDDLRLPIMPTDGAVGRAASDSGTRAPQRYDDFRAGVADPKARLAEMDLNGTWASHCFSSFNFGFAGSRFVKLRDRDDGLMALRAYNDWMIDEWCAADPARYIPMQMPWLGDPEVAAAEIRANAARGFRAVSFPENPAALGMPSLYSDGWDVFLRACEETETVVNLHVGSSGSVHTPSAEAPTDARLVLFPIHGVDSLVDWIFARVPIRFPGIKVALSEGGVSWVPMVLERLDRAHRVRESGTAWSATDPHPLDLVHRNFWFTSIEDPSAFRLLDVIGDDRVMVEVDYPHLDSTWPHTQDLLRSELEHLPPESIRKVCYANAAALYRWTEPPAGWIEASEMGAALGASGESRTPASAQG